MEFKHVQHRYAIEDIITKYMAHLMDYLDTASAKADIRDMDYAAYLIIKTKLMTLQKAPLDQLNRNLGAIAAILAFNNVFNLEEDLEDNIKWVGSRFMEYE